MVAVDHDTLRFIIYGIYGSCHDRDYTLQSEGGPRGNSNYEKDKRRSRRRTCSGGCQASAVTAARSNSALQSFSVSHSQPPSRGARQRKIRTEPFTHSQVLLG